MRATSRGFTLIELMVVVALISIMLAIAVPSFKTFIANNRASAAANDFLQGVTLARTEAIKQGRRTTMAPITAGDWSSGWVIFRDVPSAPPPTSCATTPNAVVDAAEQSSVVSRHDALPTSITVANSDGTATASFTDSTPRTYIAFDGTGYPHKYCGESMEGGIRFTDTLSPTTSVKTLCIARFGRPRIVSGSPPPTCTSG